MKMICIEGIDAVGKETVSKALEKTLDDKGFKVKRVSFPIYEGDFGRCIKDVLMGACGDAPELDHELMSPLYTLDRIAYFKANIKHLLENYDYLICDRSFYSNFMYQASKIYMKEPMMYNHNDISHTLYLWICKNFEWEFMNTDLFKCTDVQTFVLTLSEEDSLKQLNNRTEKDTNEKNRTYLSECKRFINHMTSDAVKEYSESVMQNLSLRDKHYMLYYINQVHMVEVMHVENPDDIGTATMHTVDKIIKYLELDDENTEGENFVNDESLDVFGNVAYSLKSVYNFLLQHIQSPDFIEDVSAIIAMNSPVRVELKVNLEPRIYQVYFPYLERFTTFDEVMTLHQTEISQSIPENYPHSRKFIYDGNNFKIEAL